LDARKRLLLTPAACGTRGDERDDSHESISRSRDRHNARPAALSPRESPTWTVCACLEWIVKDGIGERVIGRVRIAEKRGCSEDTA